MVPGSGVTPSPLKIDDTESKSFWRRAGLIVLVGHSSIPYTTTLNLRSFDEFILEVEAKGLLLAADTMAPLSVSTDLMMMIGMSQSY